ncbi:hypothetical protein UFOVP697_44 [uncultured Caudovirales phage]|uniref:Uncharacterized protein n=1 Tax=uncultured Caudovirales phage TaxID=2100421 RepID=A0A6J5MAJ4_9CAUD|nr:hypothetical protein UFOVP427_26 [uncultured Caudovirales phage]CAB4158330.1 hypothetical protein UFOVP697_44 [uncultured Caudovirales phage]
MKPVFRIIEENGKYAVEYLHVTKRFLIPDKKEWKPYVTYSGISDKIFWHSSIENLKSNIILEVISYENY